MSIKAELQSSLVLDRFTVTDRLSVMDRFTVTGRLSVLDRFTGDEPGSVYR